MEEDEIVDVEVMEISLNDDEIDEWILKLDNLRETKEKITLEIDDDNELEINYEESEEENE